MSRRRAPLPLVSSDVPAFVETFKSRVFWTIATSPSIKRGAEYLEIGRIYKTTAFLCLIFQQEEAASAFGACRLQAQFHSLTYRYDPTRAGAIEWLRSSTKSQAGRFHGRKKQSGTFRKTRSIDAW